MSSAPPPAVLRALLLLLLFFVSTHPADSAPAAAVRNPALARSSWPMALGGPYSAQSTDSMAPTSAENIAKNVLFDLNLLDPLSLHYAGPMGGEGDGEGGGSSSYMWTSTFTDICKIGRNATDLEVLACYVKPLEAANEDVYHGIYGFVAADGAFFDPNGVRLLALNSEDPSDPRSPIKILAHFEITNMTTGSEGLLEGESFIAMTMSFPPEEQGLEAAHAIFFTTRGRVGAVQLVKGPDGSADFVETAVPLLLGGGEEEVSNSVALDEENNVYLVTNAQLYKVLFHPPSSNATVASQGSFEVVWASPYDVLDTPVPGRLSRTGSGSTPSLMMHDGRRYVVISDGDAPQKVVVVDAEIGQVAASRVVDFGQEDIKDVFSDQSVLVSGSDLYVVNNALTSVAQDVAHASDDFFTQIETLIQRVGIQLPPFILIQQMRSLFVVLLGDSPLGIQKMTLQLDNNGTLQLTSPWSRPDLFFANGIPTLSRKTGLLYGVSRRDEDGKPARPFRGCWTFDAINATSGEEAFHITTGCGIQFNSLYAATQIGDDAELITGCLGGIVRAIPQQQQQVGTSNKMAGLRDGTDCSDDSNIEVTKLETSAQVKWDGRGAFNDLKWSPTEAEAVMTAKYEHFQRVIEEMTEPFLQRDADRWRETVD
ncbi:unnamed protein product [Vitrella brassicaformis CCMP3155]|uniref:Uncharacterized protein n=1 Tax=Vitrella brassicaformis (strain CCMP3155) TaxID=1169540 RepID=A0A0G4FH98_VITBC|nr:unnamed protein product [Vitrella brassicaformis CCMP3155]|eukprot:CEM12666.1 unnamed protein product [Vitrella brassicaformis CCMP3155]